MHSFPKREIRVLLLENIHQSGVEVFQSDGFKVECVSGALPPEELENRIQGVHLLGLRSKSRVTRSVLQKADRLLGVGCFCIGTDQVDLDSANEFGVPVFNAPYSNTRSVAEMIIGEIIDLARGISFRSMKAHQGVWDKSADGSYEIRGKTLGIVGYGHIGSQLSVLAESLGLRVLFYDTVKKLPLGNARGVDSLTTLLRESDFVSLHVPDAPDTRGMISLKEISTMKKGSFLLNASRGKVVVISDLAKALSEKHLFGAAIDVFPEEPASNKDSFLTELQGLENVILTPHIGGSTQEAQKSIGLEVSHALLQFMNVGSTSGSVNFPKVDLPVQQDSHRILNVHRNVPGVLKDINRIVSDSGANIRSQYLATDPSIGYLVMDLDKLNSKDVLSQIKSLPTTIKSRILF